MKTFLHVGCGSNRKDATTAGFQSADWAELRLDIDPNVAPDIVGTMTAMPQIPAGSVDAVFSSHNLEHLYAHEVPVALNEFRRVLKPDGFAVITCPDLQSICALVAEDKLDAPAYESPAGPIAPLDVLYGLRPALAAGHLHMAHRGGFTQRTLGDALRAAGFANGALSRRPQPHFDLWAVATKAPVGGDALRALALAHFPA